MLRKFLIVTMALVFFLAFADVAHDIYPLDNSIFFKAGICLMISGAATAPNFLFYAYSYFRNRESAFLLWLICILNILVSIAWGLAVLAGQTRAEGAGQMRFILLPFLNMLAVLGMVVTYEIFFKIKKYMSHK